MVRVPGYRPKSPRDSRDLKRENAELKRAILKPASAFFASCHPECAWQGLHKLKADLARRMHASGEPASTTGAAPGVSRATVYRVLAEGTTMWNA